MMGIHSVQLVLLFLRWVAFKAGIPSPEEEKQAFCWVVIRFFRYVRKEMRRMGLYDKYLRSH
jgi:hypothetical protein